MSCVELCAGLVQGVVMIVTKRLEDQRVVVEVVDECSVDRNRYLWNSVVVVTDFSYSLE